LFSALAYLAEINIRLNKLEEAYDNCQKALKWKALSSNCFSKLIEIICYYNMALAKYKQNDAILAQKHFHEFFKTAQKYCVSMMDKEKYECLIKDGMFSVKTTRDSLENSLKILTVIFGKNHSFVKNFVEPNRIYAHKSIFN
jgi:tetratricopeptide (TPR) repeat protein